MDSIEVKGNSYSIGKLDCFQQLHITRRLAPAMALAGISLSEISTKQSVTLDDFVPMLVPISKVIAAMPEDDVNYILRTCLSAVKRGQAGGKFAPVQAGAALMFADIDMPVMLRLVTEVVKENLGPFLQGLSGVLVSPSPSSSASPQ